MARVWSVGSLVCWFCDGLHYLCTICVGISFVDFCLGYGIFSGTTARFCCLVFALFCGAPPYGVVGVIGNVYIDTARARGLSETDGGNIMIPAIRYLHRYIILFLPSVIPRYSCSHSAE
jgi:hypothetical protein